VPSDLVVTLRPATAPVPVPATGGGHLALRRLRSERGVALVEFALVMPVLMLLFLGMLDIGKAFNYWIDTTHLANLGARAAAVDKNPGATATPAVSLQRYLATSANTPELESDDVPGDSVPAGLEVCVAFPAGGSNVGNPVEVKVHATYHFIPFVGTKISFLTVGITGSATMRLEQIPSSYNVGGNIGDCS
jgi:Flp pilus assembly protein TadG